MKKTNILSHCCCSYCLTERNLKRMKKGVRSINCVFTTKKNREETTDTLDYLLHSSAYRAKSITIFLRLPICLPCFTHTHIQSHCHCIDSIKKRLLYLYTDLLVLLPLSLLLLETKFLTSDLSIHIQKMIVCHLLFYVLPCQKKKEKKKEEKVLFVWRTERRSTLNVWRKNVIIILHDIKMECVLCVHAFFNGQMVMSLLCLDCIEHIKMRIATNCRFFFLTKCTKFEQFFSVVTSKGFVIKFRICYNFYVATTTIKVISGNQKSNAWPWFYFVLFPFLEK